MSISVTLHLEGRPVVLVGGGKVAYRKALQFLQEGACVSVISITFDDRFYDVKGITLISSSFSWKLIHHAFYIYVATNDIEVNRSILQEANRRNILTGCAQSMEESSTTSMKDIELEYLHVAVSSKGSCPGSDVQLLSELLPKLLSYNEKNKQLKILRERVLNLDNPQRKNEVLTFLTHLSLPALLTLTSIQPDEKLVLLAYHGIANMENCESSMHVMEQDLKDKIPKLQCISVFLSEKIVKKARNKGYPILLLDEMVEVLHALNIPFFIQAMLVSEGKYAKTIMDSYPDVIQGQPLLVNGPSTLVLYYIFACKYNFATICGVYHESESNLVKWSKKIDSPDQFLSFSQYERVTSKSSSLTLIPLSIFLGFHAHHELHSIWLPYLQSQGIEVDLKEKGLMEYEEIRMIFIKRIKQSLRKMKKANEI